MTPSNGGKKRKGQQPTTPSLPKQPRLQQPLNAIYRRDLVGFLSRSFLDTKYPLVSRRYCATVTSIPVDSLPRYMFKSLDVQVVSILSKKDMK